MPDVVTDPPFNATAPPVSAWTPLALDPPVEIDVPFDVVMLDPAPVA